MNWLYASVIFFSALVSGLLFFTLTFKNQSIKLLLALSGAYLFGITVLHLIPELYQNGDDHSTGMFLLAGFFLQLILDYFSEGIEHGHVHVHADNGHAHIPYTMLISLCIHAFFEGMPIGGAQDPQTSAMLLYGIIIHNIPIGLALMSLLTQSHIAKNKSILLLSVFALMTPLGMLASHFVQTETPLIIGNYTQKIMAVVIGIFLHISTTILFETSENHRFNMQKMLVIAGGIVLAISTTLLF